MAVRALIPAERLNIAHVNSANGSTDYESGSEYKAGTVVTYNGNTYVANIDIEDTDTDTPDEAPDKWGLCPNAKSLVEGGEVANLETRVSALENTVGNETSGLVKDVSDLDTSVTDIITDLTAAGYGVEGFGLAKVTSDGVKSFQTICEELATEFLNVCQSLDDDEMLIQLYAALSGIGTFIIPQVPYNNTTTGLAITGICTAITTTQSTYANVYMKNISGESNLNTVVINSGGVTFSNKNTSIVPASPDNFVMYLKLKKLITSE